MLEGALLSGGGRVPTSSPGETEAFGYLDKRGLEERQGQKSDGVSLGKKEK